MNPSLKINPNMKIDTYYHLLLFIIVNGDICYFTDYKNSKEIHHAIFHKHGIDTLRIFKKFLKLNDDNIHTKKLYHDLPMFKQLLKYLENQYEDILLFEKYLPISNDSTDENLYISEELIIAVIKKVIDDTTIIDKQFEIEKLECANNHLKKYPISISYHTTKNNYIVIISALKKMIMEKYSFLPDHTVIDESTFTVIDESTFTPMAIASSKRD
jgi:hypothetical protein